jgi:hypothetical protein
MCLQCETEAVNLGEIVPGYVLMQARKDHPDWPVGWFGVVDINDPTFVFQWTPVCDPYFGRDDEAFLLCLDEVIEAGCKASIFEAYRFVEACVKVGFDPEEGGFEAWLVHKMGLVFEKYKEQHQ